MKIIINNIKYQFSNKQYKKLIKLIKRKDLNTQDFSPENNEVEYKIIMDKYNIFQMDIQ